MVITLHQEWKNEISSIEYHLMFLSPDFLSYQVRKHIGRALNLFTVLTFLGLSPFLLALLSFLLFITYKTTSLSESILFPGNNRKSSHGSTFLKFWFTNVSL